MMDQGWRKPSHSGANGCVEVAFAKSSHSANNGCVEVAGMPWGDIVVRDSKDPDGPVLHFTPTEWDAFLKGVRGGEFDLAETPT